MKLKATIEEKVEKVRKMIKGKPESEASYYEGIATALDWVLSGRNESNCLGGFYGENI